MVLDVMLLSELIPGMSGYVAQKKNNKNELIID